MEKLEQFSSRWALLLATMGMAIGAGNIWRFPRLAGQYGGAFLIPWAIFLILWSIPLLMVEFSLGKETRKGPIGAFANFLGKKYAWMGAFIVICTMMIMFYYSVVTGWALHYFVAAATGMLTGADHNAYWNSFTGASLQPVYYHLIALSITSLIIYQGVVNGIERANRILLPSLLVLLVIGVIRSLTLPNAAAGLNYLFGFHGASLSDPAMWLEALSQSAWSTGAGWGLVLSYSVYMREKDDVTLNAFITGFGNNSASLLAALAIIPAIFSLSGSPDAAIESLKAGNQGLTFIVIPQLFEQLPGARLLTAFFFLALFFAAISSLIAMFELSTRMFMDFGMSRKKALPLVSALTAIIGLPSAFSLDVFNNQDWVWGLGLIISGGFFTFAVLKSGVTDFRKKYLLTSHNDIHVGNWYDWVMRYLIPIEAVVLLVWWFYREWVGDDWYNPFNVYSFGTCLAQWGILIIVMIFMNNKLNQWLTNRG